MSAPSRLEALEAMALKRPDDPMIQYGLATEYRKAGRLDDAVTAFRRVVALNPTYTAAWQELGSVLVDTNNRDDAIRTFREGVEVADRAGAWKARDHMRRLLDELESAATSTGADGDPGFCE